MTPQEIPPPEFVLTKPDIQWSEEEKKEYKIYENKTKSLAVEKDKYKKVIELMQFSSALITNMIDFRSVSHLVNTVIAVTGNRNEKTAENQ